MIGDARLDYPSDHIEADNRLSWYLGRIHFKYGNDAFYVHLKRNLEATAKSYAKRRNVGIMKAFSSGLLRQKTLAPEVDDSYLLARDICETVEANIRHFLLDKENKMEMDLENLESDFTRFWYSIGAEGNLKAAINSLAEKKNTTEQFLYSQRRFKRTFFRAIGVVKRRLRVIFKKNA